MVQSQYLKTITTAILATKTSENLGLALDVFLPMKFITCPTKAIKVLVLPVM